MFAARPVATLGGFTLLELMIVVTVIIALAAIGFPVWNNERHKAEVGATRELVHAVATAIQNYPEKMWHTYVETRTPKEKIYRLWDINGDGYIDGTPSLD